MITPGGTFEPRPPSYPPAPWTRDDTIDEPEADRLPDERPDPNPDENGKQPLHSRPQ